MSTIAIAQVQNAISQVFGQAWGDVSSVGYAVSRAGLEFVHLIARANVGPIAAALPSGWLPTDLPSLVQTIISVLGNLPFLGNNPIFAGIFGMIAAWLQSMFPPAPPAA